MKKVLVTGANGQLAKCIKDATQAYLNLAFTFANRDQLNIENEDEVRTFFASNDFDICINTAAYTNVEQAESDKKKAFATNADGARHLAEVCANRGIVLFHISTDYVFDGSKNTPYNEHDNTNPINVYGASKLQGEQHIIENCERHIIFRTSWLYSQYGHNFYNTILRWASEGKNMEITTEQIGTPTNANDLANVILTIASGDCDEFGLYHYSNEGEATWFDFAEAILTETNQLTETSIAKTEHYRTFAARPEYSALDTTKFRTKFGLTLHWQESLKNIKQ